MTPAEAAAGCVSLWPWQPTCVEDAASWRSSLALRDEPRPATAGDLPAWSWRCGGAGAGLVGDVFVREWDPESQPLQQPWQPGPGEQLPAWLSNSQQAARKAPAQPPPAVAPAACSPVLRPAATASLAAATAPGTSKAPAALLPAAMHGAAPPALQKADGNEQGGKLRSPGAGSAAGPSASSDTASRELAALAADLAAPSSVATALPGSTLLRGALPASWRQPGPAEGLAALPLGWETADLSRANVPGVVRIVLTAMKVRLGIARGSGCVHNRGISVA